MTRTRTAPFDYYRTREPKSLDYLVPVCPACGGWMWTGTVPPKCWDCDGTARVYVLKSHRWQVVDLVKAANAEAAERAVAEGYAAGTLARIAKAKTAILWGWEWEAKYPDTGRACVSGGEVAEL